MTQPQRPMLILILVFAASRAAPPVFAQDAAATDEIRAAGVAYVNALRQGNAAAILEFWTDDGMYFDAAGAGFRARDLVGEQFADATMPSDQSPPTSIESSVHFVGPMFAIEQGRAKVASGAETSSTRPMQFLAAWIKQNDRWRLSLLREFSEQPPSTTTTSPAATNALGALDWMIGRWTASDEGAAVELDVEWTPEKTFLLQQFAARGDGRILRRGTQRIAWDAADQTLRSWTFTADGGHTESRWRREDDVWVAESAGVLPDGRRTSSTHFWMREGENVCWFKSLNGKIDGEPTRDLILKFSREAAEAH